MRYRTLGNSGLQVSVVGLGGNNFGGRLDLDGTRSVVHAALDVGITFIDTADVYSRGRSEELLGEVLAGRRSEVVIATKFAGDMGYGPAAGAKGGRGYIRRAVEASLRRLGTDYIDLYQIHVPDFVTPVAETLSALDEPRQGGQDPLCRPLELRRLADRRGGPCRPRTRHGAVRVRPEPLVPARTWRRGRGRPSRPALRRRHPAVLPARQRSVDRQGPPWPGGARGVAAGESRGVRDGGQARPGRGPGRVGSERMAYPCWRSPSVPSPRSRAARR